MTDVFPQRTERAATSGPDASVGEKVKLHRGRLEGIQAGRAIAVVSVVITHAISHHYSGAPGLSHLLGRYGVTLFFLISGYIMVATTGPGRFDGRDFLTRRLTRIVPIYYVANAVLVVGTLLVPFAFKNTIFDPQHILLSLAFIPAYEPNGSGFIWPFFRLGWTLNYEMFFYMWFAATFAFGLRTRLILLSLGFGMLFVAGLIHPGTAAPWVFYSQVDIIGFVAGAWLGARALQCPWNIPYREGAILAILSLVSLGGIAALYPTIRIVPTTQIWLITTCAIHLVLLVSWIDGRGRRLPRPVALIGDASYSIYLFHMFAIGPVTAITKKMPHILLYPMMAVSAAVALGLGLTAYWLVEKPMNGVFRRRRAAAFTAAS